MKNIFPTSIIRLSCWWNDFFARIDIFGNAWRRRKSELIQLLNATTLQQLNEEKKEEKNEKMINVDEKSAKDVKMKRIVEKKFSKKKRILIRWCSRTSTWRIRMQESSWSITSIIQRRSRTTSRNSLSNLKIF